MHIADTGIVTLAEIDMRPGHRPDHDHRRPARAVLKVHPGRRRQDARLLAGGHHWPANTITEVWKDHPTLQSVIVAGLKGLYAGNYLDQQIPNPSHTCYEWGEHLRHHHRHPQRYQGEQVDPMNIDSPAPAPSSSDKSVTDITSACQTFAAQAWHWRRSHHAHPEAGQQLVIKNECRRIYSAQPVK